MVEYNKEQRRKQAITITGAGNPNWKGRGCIDERGYKRMTINEDNFFYSMAISCGRQRYILEHRLVMAMHLGRCLHTWEIVHHKNGNKSDNRIENLQLYSRDKHNQFTILEREIKRLKEENKCLKKQLKEA